MKGKMPTTSQSNLMYLLVCITILTGSGLLAPRLGIGTNLWINEIIWILAPVVLLIKLGKMPAEDVLKLHKIPGKKLVVGMAAAVCMWFFAFYLSKITGIFLDTNIGPIDLSAAGQTSVSQGLLLIIGMLILAPICEELLFRGIIQSAYEVHSKKYGFVYSAILFGMFHIMNGITEVIPTFLMGLMLGYLVRRTGSIAASITAHLAFNFSALFINGSLGLSFLKEIPVWLTTVAIGGMILAIILVWRLLPAEQKEAEDLTWSPAPVKYSVASIIFFVLSGIFVVCVGAFEFYARMQIRS